MAKVAITVSAMPKTLDALYASPRFDKLDYISLNASTSPWDTPRQSILAGLAIDGEIHRTFVKASLLADLTSADRERIARAFTRKWAAP